MVAVTSSSSSSSASASSSSSDVEMQDKSKTKLKRKLAESNSSSDEASDSDSESESKDAKPALKRKKESVKPKKKEEGDAEMDAEAGDADQEGEEEEIKVLSHKEQRRLKKKQKLEAQAEGTSDPPASSKSKSKEKGKDKDALPRRQNSVWVGNLSFRTTPEALRTFFDGAGEVTRVHMPTKTVPGAPKGAKGDNRGFAYVDFATPEAKTIAITLSEKNLDGRRLLIKDGGDFTGRPAVATAVPAGADGDPTSLAGTTATGAGPSTGLTKTAQKILSAQKQPAGPCLFLGNLGFEATDTGIREMMTGHARAFMEMKREREREKEKKRKRAEKKGKGKGKDDDLLGIEDEEKQSESDESEEGEGEKIEVDVGIKKVRLGTFEDSGLCKGFAFVDFTSTAHATAALTNPRNHFLDGRKLKVEYASPDAVRRGGHREKGIGGKPSEGKRPSKRSGENKYGDRPKRKREDGPAEDGGDAEDENAGAQIGKRNDESARDAPEGWWEKKQKSEDRNAKHRRTKPGAALALAQREKFAIVPSEGTRLKFD